jgi:hypothetical protein
MSGSYLHCGEAQLASFNASTGLAICANTNSAAQCASLYGPGVYTVSAAGACQRTAQSPSAPPCPPTYLLSCGVTCICISPTAGSPALLPGQNASSAAPADTISALQASAGLPCSDPAVCFLTQNLPYGLGALAALCLGALLVLYLMRRCCCPSSSIPFCCLQWRCSSKGRGSSAGSSDCSSNSRHSATRGGRRQAQPRNVSVQPRNVSSGLRGSSQGVQPGRQRPRRWATLRRLPQHRLAAQAPVAVLSPMNVVRSSSEQATP